MGFYGNITNTSNTTFQFDRIYPNRLAMDANANNDGIFIGRYVLVEYDNKATISNIFVDIDNPVKIIDEEKYYYAYTTDNFNDINTRIQYKPNNRGENKNVDTYFLGEFGQVQKIEGNQLQQEYYTEFYQCVDSIVSENNSTISYALFKYVTRSTKSDSEYIKNFAIDEAQYHEKKGYDSTVWTKASVKKDNGLLVTEYVRIADLNSVVPTFDLETDAPTMKPLMPHFDADSTNVYYKLHTQPQWGLRVAEKENGKISDAKTEWISSSYDPSTGQLVPSEDNGEHDAAIYFNHAAFLPQVDVNRQSMDGINKKAKDNQKNNYFTINPTGTSGNQYYLHSTLDQNGNLQKIYGEAVDIQEMEINLPAIGDMMSDAWDVIYGPLRDKARTDENGSLQGRLDSFTKMENNHIPIKRHDDGTLIGTAINGNQKYNFGDKNILTADDFPLTTNDPWIDVTIDNSSLQGGYDKKNKQEISQTDNNAIRIRHSSNTVDPTTTSWDKNGLEDFTDNSYSYYNIDTNINGEQDKIKLYVPYVDATGHVVGKNIETVTLPYGYKTVKAKEQSVAVTNPSANTEEVVANSTQDTLQFASSNKWIRMSGSNGGTGVNYDTFNIGHEVHPIDETVSDQGDNKTSHTNANKEEGAENEVNLIMYDWSYDEAGHITSKREHTYTLPFSYKVIKSLNSEGVGQADIDLGTNYKIMANQTQDEMQFEAANKWIGIMAIEEGSVDKIYLGHLTNGNDFGKTYYAKDSSLLNDDIYKQIPNFGDNVKILNVTVDNAGHITGFNANTITIPQGSYTPANNAEKHTDIITSIGFTPSSGAIISTKATTGTLTLSNYSANNGNLNILYTDTINEGFEKIQNHINSLDMNSTSTTEFITEITQTDGQVAVKRAAAGTLQLGTASSDGTIPATSSLNNAFNITNNRIKVEEDALAKEVQDRKDAITKEVNDRNTAISSAISAIVDKDDDGTINKLAEVIEWINNNPSTATQMQKAIQDNTKAISDEAVLARGEEEKIAAALIIETGRATAAEQANATAVGNEKTRAEKIEQELQEQIDILQTWKETATEDIANLNNTISQLLEIINDLTTRIEKLENPPQEPDEGRETV